MLIFPVLLNLGSCNLKTIESIEFERLICDYYTNPVGLENQTPGFSWIVKSDGYNKKQSAYHILLATSPEKLTDKDADVWNSGKVNSSQSVYINYAGQALLSGKRYFWKVCIWDEKGQSSGWSKAQFFEMGLLTDNDWQGAEWIILTEDTRNSPFKSREIQNNRMEAPVRKTSYPAAYFRKEFRTDKKISSAQIYVSALGYFEAYLNGEIIGDHVLDPAPTSFDHHNLYVIHDVSNKLESGGNTLGFILGNGFYGQNIAFNAPHLTYGRPALKAFLKIQYEDGEKAIIATGKNWKVSTGPIVFDNVYAGETYDARFEMEGWNENSFNDNSWNDATRVNPVVGVLRPQLLPPIKKIKELSPTRIFKGENGNWIVDFGQNISGWIKMGINEKAGQEVIMLYAETLWQNRNLVHPESAGKHATGVDQVDIYISKGSGTEIWEPRFTYHGFRYVEISGLSEKPSKENIWAVLVHTQVEETGKFHCSSDLLNQMYKTSKWTIVDNLHGIPEDCPHREKCGWLGDAHVTAEFCLYNYNMAGFYGKYLEDIESRLAFVSGKNNHEKQYRVPPMVAPGKRINRIAELDWGIAEIYIPWYNYLHNGDFSMIKKHYTDMKELVNYYLSFKNEIMIIENGLGDWCPPRWDRENNPTAMECHPYISANAYFYDVLGILNIIALKMEDKEFADLTKKEQRSLKEAFNKHFLKELEGTSYKWYDSQTATVMALQFDIVPSAVKKDVVEGLKYDIVENHKEHHSTGIHGNRYIYSVLNDLGESELSQRILTHPEFPSQAYILNCGLTTWPERQLEWDKVEKNRSLNHPMQSGFAAVFYESIAGIKPLIKYPGFKEFIIKPSFIPQLEHAKAEIKSPYGKISSAWKKLAGGYELKIEIPFNTRAGIVLPFQDKSDVQIVDKQGTDSIEYTVEKEGGSLRIVLGSGSYKIII